MAQGDSTHSLRYALAALHWPAIAAAGALALILGYIGFADMYEAMGEDYGFWDILYRDLQLFTLESGSVTGPVGWQLQIARFLAPVVTALTAIKALAVVLREQVMLVKLRFTSDHTVICGLGRKGLVVAEKLSERGEAVVVIESDEFNDYLDRVRQRGVMVLIGDAADQMLLRRARIGQARRVLAVCGEDRANAEIALACRSLTQQRSGPPLDCLVHLVDSHLCRLLKEQELRSAYRATSRLEYFNIFESGARVLLQSFPPFPANDGSSGGLAPHVLVVGCGNMGGTLVAQAAREWWRAKRGTGRRLAVTVVDREARARCEALNVRWPRLAEACALVPVELDVTSAQFERGDYLQATDRPPVSVAYVCLDDDSRGLSAALIVHRHVAHGHVPVVVRMSCETGLVSLAAGAGGGFEHLHAFGVIGWVCDPNRLFSGSHETFARVIHETYVAERRRLGETRATNAALVPWDELPAGLRESNRRQADEVIVKLAAVGCDIAPLTDWDAEDFAFSAEEIELMARLEHERWCAERRAEGWTYQAGDKDVARKRSPSLVSWEELPEAMKASNRVAVGVLPRFLADLGMQIVRVSPEECSAAASRPLTTA